MIIYFGAGGGGKSYCLRSKNLPEFFLDNDKEKWGKKLLGCPILNPSILTTFNSDSIDTVVVTSGYIKNILPQLLNLGVPREKIVIPKKSWLGDHPFRDKKDRFETASKLESLMGYKKDFLLVAVGGTALGFCRDRDFIFWDSDIDLFAPSDHFEELLKILTENEYCPVIENNSIKATMFLSSGVLVPMGIDLFERDSKTFLDTYEDHQWTWSTKMFLSPKYIDIHGFNLSVPNPPELYLSGVYGTDWKIPNEDFSYFDYNPDRKSV